MVDAFYQGPFMCITLEEVELLLEKITMNNSEWYDDKYT